MKNRTTLYQKIIRYCSIYIATMCVALCLGTHLVYINILTDTYNQEMANILNYMESTIDNDDLYKCSETLQKSATYDELYAQLNRVIEHFDNIHYLYICIPKKDHDTYSNTVLIDAYSNYDITYEPKDILELGWTGGEDKYADGVLEKYYGALHTDDISYFMSNSVFGHDYTAAMPLKNSSNKRYALLCIDINISMVNKNMLVFSIIDVLVTVLIGIFFTILFLNWAKEKITDPISKLEVSVSHYAEKTTRYKDIGQLVYVAPEIHTNNEIESLSNAITQMSDSIKKNIIDVYISKNKISDIKSSLSNMDIFAYQDALTQVKNKAFYEKTEDRLNNDIANGIAAFAIVVADLNDQQLINEKYGHNRGNEYIYINCQKICDVFKHSPVYRIAGDEFIILLENNDYNNRGALYTKIMADFEISNNDPDVKPWKRYSAAFGIATFSDEDTCVNDVFERAERNMYEQKIDIKAEEAAP
ncbi:MAG: GGDEF domain-containing protein [Pseudobutyrivibrio sp.]|nr:GGDEF domain-containing protein [Pseudobutyrivibrio sp.]